MLLEGASSVVSLAVNYYPGSWEELAREMAVTNDEMPNATADSTEKSPIHRPNAWHLARYAYGTDYHEVVKSMLRQLAAAMGWTAETEVRCFVDTAPIDEKYWAEQSGIGWRGRHSQLIVPPGRQLFLFGRVADHARSRPIRPSTFPEVSAPLPQLHRCLSHGSAARRRHARCPPLFVVPQH